MQTDINVEIQIFITLLVRKNTPQECYMNYHQFSMFTNMKTSKGSIEIKHLKEFKYKIQEISSLFDVEQNAFNLGIFRIFLTNCLSVSYIICTFT